MTTLADMQAVTNELMTDLNRVTVVVVSSLGKLTMRLTLVLVGGDTHEQSVLVPWFDQALPNLPSDTLLVWASSEPIPKQWRDRLWTYPTDREEVPDGHCTT